MEERNKMNSSELKLRFKGVSSDLAEFIVELYPRTDKMSIEVRQAYLLGIKHSLELFDARIQYRFADILIPTAPGVMPVCSQCNAKNLKQSSICWNCHGKLFTKEVRD